MAALGVAIYRASKPALASAMYDIAKGARKSSYVPLSRKEPFLNIRNAISKAVGLLALSEEVPQELMFSDDEVGVF